jgi:predicted MFS family arabinose efflux permease
MFGILCGSPIFGALSDQIGRKKTILIATIIFVVAGPVVAVAPNFYIVMAARFILAASSPGIYGTSFVLGFILKSFLKCFVTHTFHGMCI